MRLPLNKPFANERSECPSCHQTLTWYELIPVVSFVLLGGKCRQCRKRISVMYPVVELLTGCLFVLSYLQFGIRLELAASLLLVSMLTIILVSDISYMIIPNKILLFFLPLFCLIRIIEPFDPWYSPIIGSLVGFVIIAIIIIVSRGGMGAGDMKLFAVLGVILGLNKVLLAFFLSCITGAMVGAVLLLFKVVERKQPVAFGPYIIIGTILAYFYGDPILDWYLSNIV